MMVKLQHFGYYFWFNFQVLIMINEILRKVLDFKIVFNFIICKLTRKNLTNTKIVSLILLFYTPQFKALLGHDRKWLDVVGKLGSNMKGEGRTSVCDYGYQNHV